MRRPDRSTSRRVFPTVLIAAAGTVAGTMVAQCSRPAIPATTVGSPVASQSTATPTGTPTATPVARLIDRFEVVAPPDASSSPLDDVRAASSTTLLLEDFEDPKIGIPPAFASGLGLHRRAANPAAPLQQGVEWARDGESGPGVVFVQAAAAGLVRDLALAAGESAVVRARVRAVGAVGTDPKPGSLLVEALDRANKKLRIAIATRFVAPLERRLDPKRAQEWQELELFVPPLADRAGIRLSLQAGAGGMLVDRVEARSAQPWQKSVFEPRAPDDRSRVAWRRILRRGRERADCLVLGPGWTARCDVAIPASRPRLEVLLGAVAPPSSKPFTVVAKFEGRPIAERSIAAPADVAAEPFAEWHLSLEEFAGRKGRLEIAAAVAEGADPAEEGGALLVGAPLLLGSDDAPRRNLVLISIDTLRADHVGCYGAAASLTPNIDLLASRGTRFARMLSVSSWTLPSHATIFTGELPRVHGAVVPTRRVDAARTPTLAVALAEAGYSTAAFTGGGMVDPTLGFAAGFDRYTTRDPGKPAGQDDDPMQPVVDWIDRHRDQSFLLFVHTYLVHDYAAGPEYVARFPPPAGVTIGPELQGGLKGNARDIRAEHAPQLRALYPPSLAQADERVVGRLLAALEERGLADRTVVSLLSDHGEQWLEHGAIFHGDELWTELTSIPWIVRGPGVPSGHVVTATVGHVDVATTLLGRVGAAFPFETTGRDAFAGGADGADVPDDDAELEAELDARPQLLSFETIDRRRVDALVAGPWKLIRRHANAGDSGTLLLFRRDVDPGEKDDLAAREPERVRQLVRLLDAEIERCEARASALAGSESGEIQLDPELEQELRDLGYLDDSR